MKQANKGIRKRIDDAGLKQWQVAEEVGINHVTMSVWLRTPLTDEQADRVEQAIDALEAKQVVNQQQKHSTIEESEGMIIKLTQKQQAFLEAMLTTKTVEDAYKKADITRNTAYRYLSDDDWQKEYKKRRSELTDTLTSQLLQLGTEAIETLESNMTDPDATPATKNTTAKTILDYIYSNHDREQIIEELEEIREIIAEQRGD